MVVADRCSLLLRHWRWCICRCQDLNDGWRRLTLKPASLQDKQQLQQLQRDRDAAVVVLTLHQQQQHQQQEGAEPVRLTGLVSRWDLIDQQDQLLVRVRPWCGGHTWGSGPCCKVSSGACCKSTFRQECMDVHCSLRSHAVFVCKRSMYANWQASLVLISGVRSSALSEATAVFADLPSCCMLSLLTALRRAAQLRQE